MEKTEKAVIMLCHSARNDRLLQPEPGPFYPALFPTVEAGNFTVQELFCGTDSALKLRRFAAAHGSDR